MAGKKKSVPVKAHNRRPPSKKSGDGSGWGIPVLVVGVVVVGAWKFGVGPFRG